MKTFLTLTAIIGTLATAKAVTVAPNADWGVVSKVAFATATDVGSAPADADLLTYVSSTCEEFGFVNTFPATIGWVCYSFTPDLNTVDPDGAGWLLAYDAGSSLFEITGDFDTNLNEVTLTMTRDGANTSVLGTFDLDINPQIDLGLLVQPVAGNYQMSYEILGNNATSLASGVDLYSKNNVTPTLFEASAKSVTATNENGDVSSIPTSMQYAAYAIIPEPSGALLAVLASGLLAIGRRRRS